jgi:glycosyltransferase involved in cell wall biosynthesis
MILGVEGFGAHKWASVERARSSFFRALSSEFEFREINSATDVANPTLDAVLAFDGNHCWRAEPHPKHPILVWLHGGVVLSREFLNVHLPRLQTSDVLIVTCKSDITIMRKFFGEAAPVIYHLPYPIDTHRFRPRDLRECRDALSIENADYVVGFVGRLLPQKNLHQFLRMLAELKRRLTPRRVAGLVIGSYWVDYPVLNYTTENYQPYIGKLLSELDLKDDITYFRGDLCDEELELCYGAMDVLIFPTNSIDENFGYVAVESMACATPVVAAAYGGVKDTVIHDETGFLMKTWTTRSGIRIDLIRGVDDVERLLREPSLRNEMGKAGVKRTHENYAYEVIAPKLVHAVKQAIKNHAAGESRPVSAVKVKPELGMSGLLPAIDRPWEYYQNEVAEYVSDRRPILSPESKLRVAAPCVAAGSGAYVLDDPTWPASFCLSPREFALAERCKDVVSIADLDPELNDPQLIKRLIDDGLLLFS